MPDFGHMQFCERPDSGGLTCLIYVTSDFPEANIFLRNFDALQFAVLAVQKRWPFYLDAWVVLPDHIHAVLTLPQRDDRINPRLQAIRLRFARAAGIEDGLRKIRITRRPIDDLVDYGNSVRHCWFDPVTLGVARSPESWRYSSIYQADHTEKHRSFGAAS